VVRDFAIRVKTQAFIGAISLEDGMVEYAIHPRSIKTEEFQAFIKQLSDRFSGKPFAIFLDNLSVHKTNLSKDLFKELHVTPIFNIPYSPQFNGIESYFSLLKSEYKNLLLRQIMLEKPVDAVPLIKMALVNVECVKVKRCV
jgi:transposase